MESRPLAQHQVRSEQYYVKIRLRLIKMHIHSYVGKEKRKGYGRMRKEDFEGREEQEEEKLCYCDMCNYILCRRQ